MYIPNSKNNIAPCTQLRVSTIVEIFPCEKPEADKAVGAGVCFNYAICSLIAFILPSSPNNENTHPIHEKI
jgi:hypothetical protein